MHISTSLPRFSMEYVIALDVYKARRMAKRRRTEAACLPCRKRKSKCNDYRPCAGCCSRNPFACSVIAGNSNNGGGWDAAASRRSVVSPVVSVAAGSVLHAQPILAIPGHLGQVAHPAACHCIHGSGRTMHLGSSTDPSARPFNTI